MNKNFKITKNKELDERIIKILPHILGIFFIGDLLYRYFIVNEPISFWYIPNVIFITSYIIFLFNKK